MRQYLQDLDINTLMDKDDYSVEDVWKILTNIIHEAVRKFVPIKTRRRRGKASKPLWWNRNIYKARRNRLRWWNRYKESKLHEDYLKYQSAQRKAGKLIRQAKRKLEKKIADNIKIDTKHFFKYARSQMRAKETIGPIEDKDGNLIVNDNQKTATALNDHFVNMFTDENLDYMPEPLKMFVGSDDEKLVNTVIGKEQIKNKLKSLNSSKSPGADEIFPVVLKECAEELAGPLFILFNKSLKESEVPKDWLVANVVPIFKKGHRSKPGNYRPVSLTSQVCKVMEFFILQCVTEHLKKHKLIYDTQHGFRSKRSCLTNLLLFLEEVTHYVDQGFPVDAIYLDFSKAFDTVPHQRLLKKLEAHGISGKVNNWIEKWLTNRKQRVCISGENLIGKM